MHTVQPYEPHHPPSEESLLNDVAYFERQASKLGNPDGLHQRGVLIVYQAIAGQRRKALRALRDGRVEAWSEYPDQPARGEIGAHCG